MLEFLVLRDMLPCVFDARQSTPIGWLPGQLSRHKRGKLGFARYAADRQAGRAGKEESRT